MLSEGLRHLPTLVLLWLAFFFGRTLRRGSVPLIERVARIAKPGLSPALCRYTRRLTMLWSGYFVAAAIVSEWLAPRLHVASLGAVAAAAALYVGEYWIRQRLLFPGEPFPGFLQQVRDTLQVWRPWRGA